MGHDGVGGVGEPKDTTIRIPKGTTVSELAIKYNTTAESIYTLNNIDAQTTIFPGKSLKIKQNDAPEYVQLQRAFDKRNNEEHEMLKAKGLIGEYGFINDDDAAAQVFVEKDIKEGRLVFVEESRVLLGLVKIPAHYEYHTDFKGIETYGDLKHRYNLKDGVLRENNIIDHRGGNLDQLTLGEVIKIPLEAVARK
ncbi:LysM peptidoglycan-binding domain-containing protein [bacterium]|nr:LysM peptidoglycan-binding domain-containing protein [bacterium]